MTYTLYERCREYNLRRVGGRNRKHWKYIVRSWRRGGYHAYWDGIRWALPPHPSVYRTEVLT